MYSSDGRHVAAYKEWAQVKGTPVKFNRCGEMVTVMKPTFAENLRYFFAYQLNFMYWRYFMWNFSGRQNDIQGHGEVSNGNWITGIPFIDEALVGPQEDMPFDIVNNKGHNVYYMLPLLLGILGLLFQAYAGKKGIQGFWITFFLFFMTGIAIVLYLNQTPYQPRERDYAYAGSFYAFCIWIGFGVAALAKGLQKYGKLSPVIAGSVATVLCLLVPIQMGAQNWDDHDRSNVMFAVILVRTIWNLASRTLSYLRMVIMTRSRCGTRRRWKVSVRMYVYVIRAICKPTGISPNEEASIRIRSASNLLATGGLCARYS